MTVFCVHPINDKGIDISSASVYGEIKYINRRYIYPDELDGEDLPEDFVSKALKVVDAFDPEADCLLIAGDHLQLIAMSAFLTDRWGKFRVLRYDRQAGGYIVVSINTIVDFD